VFFLKRGEWPGLSIINLIAPCEALSPEGQITLKKMLIFGSGEMLNYKLNAQGGSPPLLRLPDAINPEQVLCHHR
jgi:hypothetical protein